MKIFSPLIAITLLACIPNLAPGTEGALENGSFQYACTRLSDANCDDVGFDSEYAVPAAVGAESEFDIRFVKHDYSYYGDGCYGDDASECDSPYTQIQVSSNLPRVVTRGAEGFRAGEPGVATLLAIAADGSIVDFLHLEVVVPVGISIEEVTTGEFAEGVIGLETGQSHEFSVAVVGRGALGAEGKIPGGYALQVSAADASVVSATASESDTVVVTGLAEGATTLTIALGTIERVVSVEVSP